MLYDLEQSPYLHTEQRKKENKQAEGGKQQPRLLHSIIKPTADPSSSSPGELSHVQKSHKSVLKRRRPGSKLLPAVLLTRVLAGATGARRVNGTKSS